MHNVRSFTSAMTCLAALSVLATAGCSTTVVDLPRHPLARHLSGLGYDAEDIGQEMDVIAPISRENMALSDERRVMSTEIDLKRAIAMATATPLEDIAYLEQGDELGNLLVRQGSDASRIEVEHVLTGKNQMFSSLCAALDARYGHRFVSLVDIEHVIDTKDVVEMDYVGADGVMSFAEEQVSCAVSAYLLARELGRISENDSAQAEIYPLLRAMRYDIPIGTADGGKTWIVLKR